jgi:hypothetical protein
MASYFSAEQVAELNEGRKRVHEQFANLRQRYIARRYTSERAYEYAAHGFGRRLGTLVRAIDRVYEILPPEREDIPERDEIVDATIAIHSFVVNTFGCLDNLAWVWVLEKGLKGKDGRELEPKSVGLGSKLVRKSFSNEFRAYLDNHRQWSDNLKVFRDSLAHRIPLYIPPYIVTTAMIDEFNRLESELQEAARRADFDEYERIEREQKKLGRFRPWMTHSRTEQAASILFHPQLVADFATVDEFGRTMLIELDR